MKIYLVRHANKDNHRNDPELTPIGIKQASHLAVYFHDKHIDAVYTSNSKRALQTAQIISKSLHIQPIIRSDLQERFDLQHYPELDLIEFQKYWEHHSSERNSVPKRGDSSVAAGKRFACVLETIVKNNEYLSVVVVTHGGIIVDFLQNTFLPKDFLSFNQDFLVKREKYLPEASITTIEYKNGKYYLLTLGIEG